MSTPEGWYPSPTNLNEEIRWDGERWTGEVRPTAPPATSAAAPGLPEADGVGNGPAGEPVRKRRFPLWALIAIPAAAVLVMILAGVLIVVLVAAPAADEANAKAVAVAACKQKTLDQLKAPATAKFGPMKPVDLMSALSDSSQANGDGPIKSTPRADGARSYIFSSYVDSENGFGALVRSNVSCIISVKDGKSDKDSVALVTSKN